jgi:hypothetical protein
VVVKTVFAVQYTIADPENGKDFGKNHAATAINESSLSLAICKRQKFQCRLDVDIARNI